MTESSNGGAWVARYADRSSVCVFDSEITALRYAVDKAMQVVFVPYGADATTYQAEPAEHREKAAPVCHYSRRGTIACGPAQPGMTFCWSLSAVTCPECRQLAGEST